MSEKDLAAGVLLQAVQDFEGPEPARRSPKGGVTKAWREWDEARKFCTEETGGWARSRVDWCNLAGIDPDAFLERVRRAKALSQLAAEDAQYL